jgi:hypothetical protein
MVQSYEFVLYAHEYFRLTCSFSQFKPCSEKFVHAKNSLYASNDRFPIQHAYAPCNTTPNPVRLPRRTQPPYGSTAIFNQFDSISHTNPPL